MNGSKFLLLTLSAISLMGCPRNKPKLGKNISLLPEYSTVVSIAITNAKIWTGNDSMPWAEALAVRNDSIIYVGNQAGLQPLLDKKTQLIDAQGNMLTPGFIDSHVHLLLGGYNLTSVQLRDAKTRMDFVKRIADYAATLPDKVWMTGGDWDESYWGGALPEASWVDSVTKNHPICLNRVDGHACFANTAAMQAAGITAATKDTAGGVIVRDAKGNPTGVFKDNAIQLIEKFVAPKTEEQKDKALQAAMDFVASKGVTSVHHMGTWDDLAVFRRARQNNHLKTRLYANVPLETWAKLRDEIGQNGRGDNWLRIGGLKGFVDGSLGSRTAAMLKPYNDNPKNKGFFVTSLDTIYQQVGAADRSDLSVMIHAIGDRSIFELLYIYEAVGIENGDKDRRFRIEHAQHIDPADIPRFAGTGVIASMQPYHAIDDGRWAEKYIGADRAKTAYAFNDLLNSGATVAFGSDWFVAPPTPLEGIYAAVTRRTLDDKNPKGWIPAQKISLEQALKCYTKSGAYASFEEKIKGTLEVGKLADFVLLGADLTQIAPEQIRNVPILMTVVGGRIVYQLEKPKSVQ
jgi:predicted amidohydrolase YtcJ